MTKEEDVVLVPSATEEGENGDAQAAEEIERQAEQPKTLKEITVRIANGELEAYVELSKTAEGEHYAAEEVLEILRRKNVKFGIDTEIIASITEGDLFEREFCVAKGIPQKDGTDGWFEYKFDYELNQKPKLNADGSVDYRNLHVVELLS